MTKSKLTLGLLLASASCALATTSFISSSFNDNTGDYGSVVNNAGVLIPNGSGYAALGTFSANPVGLSQNALAAAFTAFASGSFGGAGVGNGAGAYSISASSVLPASANNTKAYLVYGNGATLATSTQYAIVDTGTTYPADPGGAGLQTVNLDLNNALINGSVVVGSKIAIVRSTGIENAGATPGASSLQLVPEPSSALMALFAGATLLVRRRR